MRIITVEEHFTDNRIVEANEKYGDFLYHKIAKMPSLRSEFFDRLSAPLKKFKGADSVIEMM